MGNEVLTISRFHTAQDSGLDIGKNGQMTVSAYQSCPFLIFPYIDPDYRHFCAVWNRLMEWPNEISIINNLAYFMDDPWKQRFSRLLNKDIKILTQSSLIIQECVNIVDNFFAASRYFYPRHSSSAQQILVYVTGGCPIECRWYFTQLCSLFEG